MERAKSTAHRGGSQRALPCERSLEHREMLPGGRRVRRGLPRLRRRGSSDEGGATVEIRESGGAAKCRWWIRTRDDLLQLKNSRRAEFPAGPAVRHPRSTRSVLGTGHYYLGRRFQSKDGSDATAGNATSDPSQDSR